MSLKIHKKILLRNAHLPERLLIVYPSVYTSLHLLIPTTVPATISTGSYIQYPVIINNGKEYKEEFVCIYVYS